MGCRESKAAKPVGPGSAGFDDGFDESEIEGRGGRLQRKKSDDTLHKILVDPVVKQAFSKFLRHECGEELLLFWLACKDMQRHHADVATARKEAAIVYDKFLKHLAPMEVHVDHATRENLARDLDLSKDGTVRCGNTKKIIHAFNLPREKVFQTFNEHFRSAEEAHAAATSIAGDMSLEYVLFYHPMGAVYFKTFLYQDKAVADQAHTGDELFELLLEIDDFHSSPDAKHREARAQRIINRFAGPAPGIASLQKLGEDVTSKPRLLREPDNAMFEEVRKDTHNRLLNDFYEPFMESAWFDGLKENVSLVFSPAAATTRVGRTGSLIDFAKERDLANKIKKMDEILDVKLTDVLVDSLGVFYFKKFCRTHFMEECILFWLEVEHFKKGDVSTPAHGTAIFVTAGGSALLARRTKIINKYIDPGSRMEVNIPTAMRQRIYDVVKSADTPQKANLRLDIFEEAQAEIFKLMADNLWGKFQKGKICEVYKQKLKTKIQIQQYGQMDARETIAEEEEESEVKR